MKTKIVLFSILTAACIFVFTSATWADGKKDRGHSNPKQKQYTVTQHHKPDYRHNPYYRHHGKQRPDFKPRHFIKRPVQKNRDPRLHRPIYSRTDGNVSILASTSHHGWLIKIFSRD